jgi:hypothetical protein
VKADPYDVKTVFGFERQLLAPLFQRPYVWKKKEQWEPLWQDVRRVAEMLLAGNYECKPHFLGAVILDQMRVPVGKPDARSIIDGQQRLACDFSKNTLHTEFGNYFHVRYRTVFERQGNDLVLVKGSPTSRSFHKAYQINEEGKDRTGKEQLYVEVKGTQTKGDGIFLTSGEVAFARQHRGQMALFLLHSVTVSEHRGSLTNGQKRVILPWDVDQGCLKPMAYKYEVPRVPKNRRSHGGSTPG